MNLFVGCWTSWVLVFLVELVAGSELYLQTVLEDITCDVGLDTSLVHHYVRHVLRVIFMCGPVQYEDGCFC